MGSERRVAQQFSHKLLLVNQYYVPDIASTGQFAADICNSLVKHGFEIHVVTGQPSYSASSPEAPAFEVLDGVHVYRVSLGRARGRERRLPRLAGYMRFLWGAWWSARALVKSQHFDAVLTFHNPPFVSLIGAYLAVERGLPYVFALPDIHPDFVVQGGWYLPRWLIRVWESLNDYVFQRVDTVIVLGEGMKRNLVEDKGVPPEKVKVIPLWARPEFAPLSKDDGDPLRRELGVRPDEFVLLYAGNMGLKEPLDPILDAAAALEGEPVHFVFLGGGVKRGHLVARVRQERLAKVHVLPFQPEERFVQLVAAADACFVSLKRGFERISVPSRAYTFLSAGRPLITLMAPDADIARLVTENACGWNVKDGDELAQLVKSLINDREELSRRGQKAREIYEEQFRREIVLEQYARVIQNVIRKPQRVRNARRE